MQLAPVDFITLMCSMHVQHCLQEGGSTCAPLALGGIRNRGPEKSLCF